MNNNFFQYFEINSRRDFLKKMSAGAAGLAFGSLYHPGKATARITPPKNSRVTLFSGSDHRESTYTSLKPFEKEVEKAIGDKQVVIKPNVGQVHKEYWLNASDAGQLRGILDFLKPIYDRKIIIAEGTATESASTFTGYENFGYLPLQKEYNVKFIDLNDEPTALKCIQADNLYPLPINLINTYLDPDIYLISAARMKNSGGVVATLSLKNVAMGSPVNHYKQKIAEGRNEKTKVHSWKGKWNRKGQTINIFLLTQMGIYPDLAVIDGVVGMEGNGPVRGTPIEHGVAVASTDFLAADRLAVELMGYDYSELKYLVWCGEAGMGQDDLSKIEIIGPDYRNHIVQYKHNDNYEQQVAWVYEDLKNGF